VVDTQINLGFLLSHQGQFERAKKLLLSARKSLAQSATPLDKGQELGLSAALGWIYLHQGKRKEAKKQFARVLFACDGEKCQEEGRSAMGKARFGMAKILWPQKGTSKRALDFARRAQEDFETGDTVPAQEFLRDIQQWREKHDS